MADKVARDARLDELAASVTTWADKKKARLEKQVAFSKALLKGRTGAERLNNAVVTNATELLVDEIGQFLTGA